jgi:hypothetical protein
MADNWCDLVVDAAAERMEVEGFRFGSDLGADDAAWQLWGACGLDSESAVGHTDAIKSGEFNVLVEPPQGDEAPQITVEHPAETIVERDPADPRHNLAALKVWVEENGRRHANVYLPDQVWKFGCGPTSGKNLPTQFWMPARAEVALGGGWELEGVVKSSLGEVSMIPFLNRAGRRGGRRAGRSDIAGVIPIQDLINKILADAVVASEYAAYPQRWATGIEPDLDEDGNEKPIQEFVAAISRFWTEGSPDAKFGTFEAADLTKYVALIEMAVQHIAAQTRTPPHYLLGQSGNFPSGESLKSTETGLVARVKRKNKDFGPQWVKVMQLAFKSTGDERHAQRGRTLWTDPESRTEGERVDALVKMRQLGVPRQVLWEKWGTPPDEIERWVKLAAQESAADLIAGLGFNPAPAATNAAVVAGV